MCAVDDSGAAGACVSIFGVTTGAVVVFSVLGVLGGVIVAGGNGSGARGDTAGLLRPAQPATASSADAMTKALAEGIFIAIALGPIGLVSATQLRQTGSAPPSYVTPSVAWFESTSFSPSSFY